MKTWALRAALAIAGVAAAQPPARACEVPSPSTADVPANGQVDVPRHTVVTNVDGGPLVVERTGETIALDPAPAPAASAGRVFRPRGPLPANEWIRVGTDRRFQTGAALDEAAPGWAVVRVVHNREPRPVFGCAGSSCAGLETMAAHMRPLGGASVPRPLFHITSIQSPGGDAVLFAFVEPVRAEDGTFVITVQSASHAIVPASASDARGTPLLLAREEGGCQVAAPPAPRAPLLPLALLATLRLSLRVRRGQRP
jgi:hypothetical protein